MKARDKFLFGPVQDATGARNYFGEDYRHHRLMGPLKPRGERSILVAKTTTLDPNAGNMPMKEDGFTPRDLMPACIMPNFRKSNVLLSMRMLLKGLMLNAVGLSGPGAKALLKTGRWQEWPEPIVLSFMAIKKNLEERRKETEGFAHLLASHLSEFRSKVGLQINLTCPNVGLDVDMLVYEAETGLDIFGNLGIPLQVKLNLLTPISAAKRIARHYHCHSLCITNTIPWGKLPEMIDWKKLFGTEISPLAEFGGGGLSGWPLFAPLVKWVRAARYAGIEKPINAGGGITRVDDVDTLCQVGASSIFTGTVRNTQPWRVGKIHNRAYEFFAT